MKLSHALHHVSRWASTSQTFLGLSSSQPHETVLPTFAFSEDWQVLGPFQIGTREGIWGADPLEQYGGFKSLSYEEDASFASSLPFNGTVSWSNATAKLGFPRETYAHAELSIDYPDVDWNFLQQVYGWAALQWQGWARGKIMVQRDNPVVLALNAEHVLEYWVNNVHYFGGDFYGFGRAPTVLWLDPGVHQIDVRLVRDVRAMGGHTEKPAIDVKLELMFSREGLKQGSRMLIADSFEDSMLAAEHASVVLRNNDHEGAIFVESVEFEVPTENECLVDLVAQAPIKLNPGQSRPIAVKVVCITGGKAIDELYFRFNYRTGSTKEQGLDFMQVVGLPRTVKDKHTPHKITYLHPGGKVSYAILRPPSKKAVSNCANDVSLPVLLVLHGAGLEAESDLVTHALDPLPDLCAWVLFPTGVTPWSSDDWHTWGFADVEAAVAAIPTWIEKNHWKGPAVDTGCWLVTGHSNGGQGAWYALTHRPDKVMAAAPLSGYSSIQNYVPYTFWTAADPARSAVVQAGLNAYRHELLLDNAKGVPILQQHGSADDNVPAYHSRLIHHLLEQAGAGSEYVEVKGKPHWWDGVMTTPQLAEFYQQHLNQSSAKPSMPVNHDFTVVTADPAGTGSKNGLQILLLATPGQLGRIKVVQDPLTSACAYHTENVRMFRFPSWFRECSYLTVDDERVEFSVSDETEPLELLKTTDGQWTLASNAVLPPHIRQGRQLGSVDAILRSRGPFQVVTHSANEEAEAVTLQISKNFCQYFYADAEITSDFQHAVGQSGNIISVAIGEDLPASSTSVNHAIELHYKRLTIRDMTGSVRGYSDRGKGLATAFLRPLPDERLELVLWSVDAESLAIAARLVPMMTGTGVPDFVVADKTMLWKGVEGTLAMGYFDEKWNVSMNAFFS